MTTWLPNPTYVHQTMAKRVEEIDPIPQFYKNDTYPFNDVANATPEYGYISMDGYKGLTVHCVKTGGTDTFDVVYEVSNEGYGATDSWLDATTNGFTVTAGANLQSDHFVAIKPESIPKGVRFEITTAGGSDDADFSFFVKKLY